MNFLIKTAAVCVIFWVLFQFGLIQVWGRFAIMVVVPLLACALLSLAAVLAWQWLRLPREEFERRLDLLGLRR